MAAASTSRVDEARGALQKYADFLTIAGGARPDTATRAPVPDEVAVWIAGREPAMEAVARYWREGTKQSLCAMGVHVHLACVHLASGSCIEAVVMNFECELKAWFKTRVMVSREALTTVSRECCAALRSHSTAPRDRLRALAGASSTLTRYLATTCMACATVLMDTLQKLVASINSDSEDDENLSVDDQLTFLRARMSILEGARDSKLEEMHEHLKKAIDAGTTYVADAVKKHVQTVVDDVHARLAATELRADEAEKKARAADVRSRLLEGRLHSVEKTLSKLQSAVGRASTVERAMQKLNDTVRDVERRLAAASVATDDDDKSVSDSSAPPPPTPSTTTSVADRPQQPQPQPQQPPQQRLVQDLCGAVGALQKQVQFLTCQQHNHLAAQWNAAASQLHWMHEFWNRS